MILVTKEGHSAWSKRGKVLEMLSGGKRIIGIASQFKVNWSTIRTMKQNSEKAQERFRVWPNMFRI